MGLKGNNFHHKVKFGTALAAQSVTSTTVSGATIAEPWKHGRQISFVFVGGAFAASSSGRLKVQGLLRSDGVTWENLKEPDAATDLEFDPLKLDDAGAGENGTLVGTLDLGGIDGEKYKAIRVTFQAENANAQLVAVAYLISDLYTEPSGSTDELWSKQRYG